MQYFRDFEYEIKINIFKYVTSPMNLALTCRNWSVVVKDPYAKYEWLIVHYGKEHALFHAIRLGPTFIDIAVYQILIARKVVIPRYFISELKMEHNADRIYALQQKIKSLLSRNLSTTALLAERYCTNNYLMLMKIWWW